MKGLTDLGSNDQGADATDNRWLTIPRTLCFVFFDNDVLLMKRAPTRRIFPNKFNGLGGHIEHFEDPKSAAIREIKEESGLDVHNVRLCGIHNINTGQETGILLFVFTAWAVNRNINSDEREGTLHWIPREFVLTTDLVEDLPHILPRILSSDAGQIPWFTHVSYNHDDQIVLKFAE